MLTKEDIKKATFEAIREANIITRNDIKKGIYSLNDAMYILGFTSKSSFSRHINKKESLVAQSTRKGTYNLDSVYKEMNRLNNTK